MELDVTYHPTVPRHSLPTEYRVIPLGLLDDSEQLKVLRAMNGHPNGRGAFSNHEEPDVTKGGDYWCIDAGTLTDFMINAQKTADVTRRRQVIHRHASFEECDGFEHIEVVHDEVRSVAVGGRQHG